ncbi:MAG: hypothetical protein FJZ01_06775 [Candidatus Sericytochromatia bacterium]|nr:hypothetical protein [Candidatus Tanganyikabacteria bacterium]
MVIYSVSSLLFFVAAPGQSVGAWQAPAAPGVYQAASGKTALVGLPPAKIAGTVAPALGAYPPNVAPLLVPVTARNRDTRLSEHFKLGDFLCKGHKGVVSISPRIVAKLESLIGTLRQDGYQVGKLRLLSAYRTPGYNRAIGNETSRSRHIHGDAADVLADDFNRDGRIDRADARILMAAVDRLDKDATYRGGASMYPPAGGHGWFVHTDTRGSAVRW